MLYSVFLGGIGIVLVFLSISILTSPKKISDFILGAPGSLYIVGFLELIFSSFLLALWVFSFPEKSYQLFIIAILFFITFLESMSYLMLPSSVLKKYKQFIAKQKVLRVGAAVQLTCGVVIILLSIFIA